MRKVVVVGSSPLGREMLRIIQDSCEDLLIMGYVDDSGESELYKEFPICYLGRLRDWKITQDFSFLIALENVALKIRLVEFISGSGGRFMDFIHPTAVIGKFVTMGEGVFIGPYCFVGDYCHLGSFSILKSRALVRKNASVGLFCLLKEQVELGEGVTLGDGNYLGVGSIIRSFHIGFHLEDMDIEYKDPLNFKESKTPWFRLN